MLEARGGLVLGVLLVPLLEVQLVPLLEVLLVPLLEVRPVPLLEVWPGLAPHLALVVVPRRVLALGVQAVLPV